MIESSPLVIRSITRVIAKTSDVIRGTLRASGGKCMGRRDAGAHDLLSEGNELLFDRKFLLSEGNELGSEVRFWQLRPNELLSHA